MVRSAAVESLKSEYQKKQTKPLYRTIMRSHELWICRFNPNRDRNDHHIPSFRLMGRFARQMKPDIKVAILAHLHAIHVVQNVSGAENFTTLPTVGRFEAAFEVARGRSITYYGDAADVTCILSDDGPEIVLELNRAPLGPVRPHVIKNYAWGLAECAAMASRFESAFATGRVYGHSYSDMAKYINENFEDFEGFCEVFGLT